MARNLLLNTDEFFQFAQVKATLRLLRDDETVDKDLLAYADHAVSAQFNKLLRDAVPGLEKAERSVGEMLAITEDSLLRATRDHRYIVRFNDITMPFEDLRYWPLDSGYALSISDNRNTTILSKEEGVSYKVKCPKCDDQAVRLIKKEGELQAIACSSCRAKLVRLETERPLRRRPRRRTLHRQEEGV